MPIDLAHLAANAELVERLAWKFDLQIDIGPPGPAGFTIDGISKVEPIGGEGAGGWFVRLPYEKLRN